MRPLAACLLSFLLTFLPGCTRPPAGRGDATEPPAMPQPPEPPDTAAPPASRGEAAQAPLRRYRVRDNGVRCITAPCPSYDAASPEGGVEQVHEVDLSALGLSEAQQQAASRALAGSGLTVQGRILRRPHAGPAGEARVLRVEALVEGPGGGG